MDIEQSCAFSKLSLGDKRKHLYAIYVIQELDNRGSITINDEFNIYSLDVNYMNTFDSKEIESKLYGKKQSKTSKKDIETTPEKSPEESLAKSVVPETPSKTPRKPRAKKTEDIIEVTTAIVPETPSKTPRKPRAKKTETTEVTNENVVVPETPSKTPRKPRAKKTETPVEILPTPTPNPEKVIVEESIPVIPETPLKKRGPSKKKTVEVVVEEEPKSIADKIVECVPKKEKKPKKQANNDAEESVQVEEEQVPRSLTPELTEELLPNISVVETENEDGVAITYLLDNNTSLLYNSDDHSLKKSIGRMKSSDEIELFE